MNPLGWIKGIVALAVITACGLGYWHYTSIVDDLADAKASVVSLTSERDAAIKTANDNAEAVKRADADRLRVVSELETVQAEKDAAAALDLQTVTEILTAPDTDDGPVSLILKRLRVARFGGKP